MEAAIIEKVGQALPDIKCYCQAMPDLQIKRIIWKRLK